MKEIILKRWLKDMALYIGLGAPYFFLLYNLGVEFSGLKGTLYIIAFYVCIDLVRWGLKK